MTDQRDVPAAPRQPSRRLMVAVSLGCLAISCGSSSRSPTTPTPAAVEVQLTSLQITGNTSLTAVGETSQLSATARFSDQSQKDVSLETIWTSADPSVVTVSSSGLLTVLRFGAAVISARYQTRSATVSVRPSPPGTFVIAGWAREPGEGGVAGVTVTDVRSLGSTQTNSGGNYSLAGLPAPETRLRFEKSGYEPAELNATQMNAVGSLQRIIRVSPGDTVSPPRLAPNDLAYVVGGDRCFPCRLVRIVTATAGTCRLHVTWGEPRVTFSLWANGSVATGSNSDLVADVPVRIGETIVYIGIKLPAITNTVFHVPFTIEASLQ